ncbi:uncharacterized protein LOC132193965 isoform X1 [Neocloeon triangulifer]|uniref:uncharacterized protein LOC132193965 isoform X1 n=1 Tax=Neocloeon triangulifer TaxID=2078957 RepID=UPI00286F35A2|nr:uncharacterized protein LOC132193965 isoform X1 [Neocloeon triangulifer]
MERLTMARFASMVVLLVAAALASQPSTKPEESEFRQKILQNLNETNQKLNQLIRIVDDQVVETRKQNEFSKASNDRLDQLARTVDLRLNQTVERVEQEVKNFNESTFERIYQLEKQIDQEKRMELDDREKLDALVNLAGRHIQFSEQTLLAARCTLARSSKLTFLSNDKMYFFSYPINANWTSANETCSKRGLNFATIKDQNEAKVVAAEAHRIHTGAWWVSAKNQASGSEKDFRWNDGTKLELDSPMWVEGADKRKDCVLLYNAKGKLNSCPSNFNQPFICELPSQCF